MNARRGFVALAGLLLLTSCVHLKPPAEPPPYEAAVPPADAGPLAELERTVAVGQGVGASGFMLLDRSADALTWRLALLDTATTSLDVVYYLWFGDDIGALVLDRVLAAAERGVKVRLLVDDLLMIGNDRGLVAIDNHPNVELRLFNPKRQRAAGMATSALLRFGQFNSRMHNKLIVADNRAVILGGRNIGVSYFGLSEKFNFHDLDVLGVGPVARDASELFDNFWNSTWSVPASNLPFQVKAGEYDKRRVQLRDTVQSSTLLEHFPRVPVDWREHLAALPGQLHFGVGRIIHDRMDDETGIVRGMVEPLGEVLRAAERDIRIVNAYIIPNDGFIAGLEKFTGRGISVGMLTNSLASHDLPAVNSHYKKWRKPLLEAGAELYELRSDPAILSSIQTPPVASSHAGLHSKTVVIDTKRVFIGSFNFDPRSADINTEMGVIIDSPGLAAALLAVYERDTAPENAWQVLLDENGDLLWKNSVETVDRQPARSTWQRVQDVLFMVLPVSQF